MISWRSYLVWIAMLLVMPLEASAQSTRQMPSPPTPAVSTAPGGQSIVIMSRDFEEIQNLEIRQVKSRLRVCLTVKLLSKNPGDFGRGLDAKVWVDLDGDGKLTDHEVVLDDSQFASQAGSGSTLTFAGTSVVPDGVRVSETTLVRACLLYGEEPCIQGTFTYGDVVDRSCPVTVRGPRSIPVLAPGPRVRAGTLTIRESSAGRAGQSLALVSPKGTAISLSRSKISVRRGNIRLGRPRRVGRMVVIPVQRRSTSASVIQITPVMRISTGFLGPLAVKTNLHKQTVTVGTVEEPVEISRDGKIETVRVGSDQAVGALTIRESVAGQMNRPILVVSPKGTAISLSRTRVDLISGDVRIGRLSRNAPNVMKIPIRSSSTRPSVIRVELVLYIRGHASTVIRIGSNVSDQLIPVGRLKKPAAYRRWRSSRQVRRFWRRLRELRPWRWWR